MRGDGKCGGMGNCQCAFGKVSCRYHDGVGGTSRALPGKGGPILMRKLTVSLERTSYPIYIGSGTYGRLPDLLTDHGVKPDRTIMIVSDTHVGPLYAGRIQKILGEAGYRVGLS